MKPTTVIQFRRFPGAAFRGVLLPLGVWDPSWNAREGHFGMIQVLRCLVEEAKAGKEWNLRGLTGNKHGETGKYEDNSLCKQAADHCGSVPVPCT